VGEKIVPTRKISDLEKGSTHDLKLAINYKYGIMYSSTGDIP